MHHPIHKTVFFSSLAAIIMLGFSFAMAPLYNAICKPAGLRPATRMTDNPDYSHPITLQFVAVNNRELPWEFYPRTPTLTVHPDQTMSVLFHAKNTTQKTMTVQAIPSFSPLSAAQYFRKIKCFCFNQQTLAAGESVEMPMVFRIDKNLPREVHTITLAYTLFDVGSKKKKRT